MENRPAAGLPMYDWPEVQWANDELWTDIAGRLGTSGIVAPNELWRTENADDLWGHPDLFIVETCGHLVVHELRGRAEVLGAFDHAVDGCRPGDYRSVLVCRVDEEGDTLEGFRGRVAAVNQTNSHSGHGAFITTVVPLAVNGSFFADVEITGSHRASMRAVANGSADLACIDEVSWRLGLDHELAVDNLRIIAWTDPMPAPPLVTSWANVGWRDAFNTVIAEAVAFSDLSVRESLHLYGYRPRDTADYGSIREHLIEAESSGYPVLA